jgi:hypothetical protein
MSLRRSGGRDQAFEIEFIAMAIDPESCALAIRTARYGPSFRDWKIDAAPE